MKLCVAGQGAFGQKHLAGLARIEGVEVVSLAGGSAHTTEAVAEQFGIRHWTTDLAESLAQPGVEAAILTSPTQLHAAQAEQCMRAGKHVEVEIPMADSLADCRRLGAGAGRRPGWLPWRGTRGASIRVTNGCIRDWSRGG